MTEVTVQPDGSEISAVHPDDAIAPSTSGNGTSLTTIPISTDEGAWTNDGSWTFNGDGTVTSTVSGGSAFLPLSAVPGAVLQLDLTLAVNLAALSSPSFGVGNSNGNMVFFINPTAGNTTQYYAGDYITGAHDGQPTGTPLVFRMVATAGGAVGYVGGVLDCWGINLSGASGGGDTAGLVLSNTDAVAGSVIDLSACVLKVASIV